MAIQKDGDNPVNQLKLEVITRSRHKARENVHAPATIGFGFTSDWLKIKSGARTLNQSLSEVMQNQSNSLIFFANYFQHSIENCFMTATPLIDLQSSNRVRAGSILVTRASDMTRGSGKLYAPIRDAFYYS